ncbi:MAG: efflux RND transporter periplasmic adaptor subunit [Rhodobacteraceae bacterium]|nr:efflux RND transporter periplasmic adaptor subunit [Paracoccaceae bacterium]
MTRIWLALTILFALVACKEDDADPTKAEKVIRGLKTVLVEDVEKVTVRRFPSVLQPASVATLSFEVAGKLTEIDLKVGQRVNQGDVIARIDPTAFELRVQNSKAALELAQANADNAAENLERQETLLASGTVTKVAVDNARTNSLTTAAQVTQAEKNLETAKEDLGKTTLQAPYDSIINTLDVESFATISVGARIATVYTTNTFEVSFSVNYEVVNLLTVGKRAKVRLADNPTVVLNAVVSELGSRADTVSSFPVVVTVTDADASIKAGMAVEVSLEFSVSANGGYTVPLSAAIKEGRIENRGRVGEPARLGVYVFDPDTSTVKKRMVMVAGVSENSLLVVDGLSAGERVASAGVSFLRDGQKVKLLPDSK